MFLPPHTLPSPLGHSIRPLCCATLPPHCPISARTIQQPGILPWPWPNGPVAPFLHGFWRYGACPELLSNIQHCWPPMRYPHTFDCLLRRAKRPPPSGVSCLQYAFVNDGNCSVQSSRLAIGQWQQGPTQFTNNLNRGYHGAHPKFLCTCCPASVPVTIRWSSQWPVYRRNTWCELEKPPVSQEHPHGICRWADWSAYEHIPMGTVWGRGTSAMYARKYCRHASAHLPRGATCQQLACLD